MKENVHPNYHTVKVVCACGNSFETGSTKDGDLIKIDICNKCHPFFTGTQKIVDAGEELKDSTKDTELRNSCETKVQAFFACTFLCVRETFCLRTFFLEIL